MDREKLEKASDDFAHSIPDFAGGGDFTIWHVIDAFEQGADWLMQQPLSERLTDEEKEKLTPANRYILGTIFGADLFK